jgi:hypothetical protein
MRAKGVVVTLPETKPVGLAVAAKKILAERKARLDADRARKAAIPVPNYKCYPDAFKQYDPKTGRWTGGRLPKCRVCGDTLQPTENHTCPGFQPKYVEHDDAWHERQDARREEIRASKTKIVTCDGCGAALPTLEGAQWHEEYCVTDEVRAQRYENRMQARYAHHNAINGDEDDLSGYEDEQEEDYCEGDDDGYDCD